MENEDKVKRDGKFLGIMFKCCNVYVRIYKNKEGTAYVGCCPKCYNKVRVPIGKDGTGDRIFYAD